MSCPVCGASEYRRLYDLPSGGIVACRHCGLVRRHDVVGGEAARELYDDAGYLDSPFFDALKVGAPTDVEPYLLYERVLDQLEAAVGASRLLDIGCSFGAFMALAEGRGWDVHGVELSEASSAYARAERHLDVFHGTLEQARFPDGYFSAVTLWDVVEHLDRPIDTMREVARVLRPGGVAFVLTVNQKSLINRVGDVLYRLSLHRLRRPLALLYDVHHNFFFSETTLLTLLAKAGLQGPATVTGWDANIERWRTTDVPAVLALGSSALDIVARATGQRYRLLVYASKPEARPRHEAET